MAEPFFLAAWTAGIIEGASILSHERTKSDDVVPVDRKSFAEDARLGLTNFLLPSIVYGAAADHCQAYCPVLVGLLFLLCYHIIIWTSHPQTLFICWLFLWYRGEEEKDLERQ